MGDTVDIFQHYLVAFLDLVGQRAFCDSYLPFRSRREEKQGSSNRSAKPGEGAGVATRLCGLLQRGDTP